MGVGCQWRELKGRLSHSWWGWVSSLPAFLWSQNHRLIHTEIHIIWRHPVYTLISEMDKLRPEKEKWVALGHTSERDRVKTGTHVLSPRLVLSVFLSSGQLQVQRQNPMEFRSLAHLLWGLSRDPKGDMSEDFSSSLGHTKRLCDFTSLSLYSYSKKAWNILVVFWLCF